MDAQSIIGRHPDEDDYILVPEEHAERLPEEARALKEILRAPRVADIVQQYRRYDSRAINAQGRYKRLTSRLIFCSTLAVLAGGLFLLTNPTDLAWADTVRYGVIGVQAIALLGVAVLIFRLRDGRQFEEWMTARSAAEDSRITLFETVCGMRGGPAGGADADAGLLSLQLEYFRRYQLDVQRGYYASRARKHRRAANSLTTLGTTIVVLGAILTLFQNFLPPDVLKPYGITSLDLYAFAGLIVPVMYQARETFKLLSGDLRNALRYERTHHNLTVLHNQLDGVRAAVAAGDQAVLHGFVRAVHEQISVENREWSRLPESEGLISSDMV